MTTMGSSPTGFIRPDFTRAEATGLALRHYGLEATACQPLPSDRDQNFRLEIATGDLFVLKFARSGEDRTVLEAQNIAMQHAGPGTPEVCPSLEGTTIVEVPSKSGERHWMRLLTYLPGSPLGMANPATPALRHSLGHFLGTLDRALATLDLPAAQRKLPWDLQHGFETIEAHFSHLKEADQRKRVGHFLKLFEQDTVPMLPMLRRSIIHGDANDYNVLVTPPALSREVIGLVDFGDLVYSWTVADLAIGATYAMLDQPDPVGAAAEVIAGYHGAFPLDEGEIGVLWGLITLRLCVSVVMSAYQKTLEPTNDYLTISERPAWALLERLHTLSPALAHYRFRAACGVLPCSRSESVVRWLRENTPLFTSVVRPSPRQHPVRVFDFSVGSTEWEHTALATPLVASAEIERRLHEARASVGVGRYDEARVVYNASQFETDVGERRTIHLGIDLFQPAGSPVFVPLDGIVHSFADNAQPLDYGPTIIVEHRPVDAPPFFTLYGHLSRASLKGLQDGQSVRQGEELGRLGDPTENGGWTPHLHFQIICDMLDRRGEFPGVAPPSQRTVWLSLCPDPNLILGIPGAVFPPSPLSKDQIRVLRREHIGSNLGLSYRSPLHIVRGFRQYLFDADGRAYLDGINNVAHVGHSHPRVVEASYRQMRVLNTNTRYLHENLSLYAERLAALFPESLSVCFFVNSGSEANDLALRLALAHTGRHEILVLDGAYHGHLSSLIGLSPYKFNGPGGSERPPHTHVIPTPNSYRGLHRGADTGPAYADHVRRSLSAIQAKGLGVAAFFAEPILSCGGQVIPPEGFLQAAFGHVRAAGGVCIADEVQTGFGRVGTHGWAFEAQGVVPDIVTLGKPIGNGHPLGAVVTTPEIAASFANGMEYFNTFGGNPVSCAAGLAVLDVIEDEALQSNASHVGSHLLDRLRTLQERHAIIGDVRGCGLFIGVEFVLDRTTLAPAAAQATYVVERMKETGILLSTDGPLHNVIKIKPPLCFTADNADRLADALDRVLTEDFCRV